MNQFFSKIKYYWENNGFEMLAIICIVIIFILYVYNVICKNKGTYSEMILSKLKRNNSSGNINDNSNIEYMEHTINDSKLELQCKFHLENIFKMKFHKIRPDFLRNDVTGYNLEIDLYNDELKLAVEVQGDQHYKFTPFFHRNKETFMLQRYRDEMKKQKCKK